MIVNFVAIPISSVSCVMLKGKCGTDFLIDTTIGYENHHL